MIAPPAGKSCVNVGGTCTITNTTGDKPCSSDASCSANEYCYQPPMPACPSGAMCKMMMPARVCRPRKVAGEGQTCGGIAGIMCASGLTCRYPVIDGIAGRPTMTMADRSGTCVSIGKPAVKCGWCGTGCVDVSRGDMMCTMIAPPAGKSCENINGKCTITPSDKPCSSDASCSANEYCYQPPMPVCKPGTGCIDMMPMRVCRACTPRPACLDANPACMIKMVDGMVFCPKPTKVAQEGQMCGGIAGIMCATGLTCRYPVIDGIAGRPTMTMADRSGTCVSIGKPVVKCGWCGTGCVDVSRGDMMCTMIAPPSDKVCVDEGGSCVIRPGPSCIPRPPCMDGIKDANGNMIYCDAKPGTVYCPITKIKGDANGDSRVDLADFSIWKKEYLKELSTNRADFDKSGKVDLIDFSIWKTGYLINNK